MLLDGGTWHGTRVLSPLSIATMTRRATPTSMAARRGLGWDIDSAYSSNRGELLPIGSFAETSGTFVNAEGRWQSWAGAAKLLGEARPGWKVLRVLANLLNIHGVDYESSEEIREALKALCGTRIEPSRRDGAAGTPVAVPEGAVPAGAWVDIPPYQSDALVRGSEALSKTKDGRMARAVI
jgi:NADH-quinone oxidoreductase subunit G